MATRCTIWFHDGIDHEPAAIVYRHWDGYPEADGEDGDTFGILPDLREFFDEIERQTGSAAMFDIAGELAARYVVWQAARYAAPGLPLVFRNPVIMREDPGDIQYRYHVHTSSGFLHEAPKTGHPSVTYEGDFLYGKDPRGLVQKGGY